MLVTALCRTHEDAEYAVTWLRRRGYGTEEIGLVLYEDSALQKVDKTPEEQALRHALPLASASVGISTVSMIAGVALAGGPAGLAAAGPLALLLSAVGALSFGGIVGMLEGAGIPNDDTERYADELKRGGVIVSVTPHPGDDEAVHAFFARFG